MKRRDFLKTAIPAAALPVVLNGFNISALAKDKFQTISLLGAENDRILVLIQLNGGNDGLNTVIPLDQYSALSKVRGNILIPEKDVLKLNDSTGFHPSMTGMKNLWDDGKIGVVQNTGYPNPNFSHFRSTDIWTSGSDSDKVLTSGWLGRYLAETYPGYPEGYPSGEYPHPVSITVGNVVSTTCQGPSFSMGLAINATDNFYDLVSGGIDTAPDTYAGLELEFIRTIIAQTQQYTDVLKGAAEKGENKSTLYPAAGQNGLADQLRIVAQLISGGLKTKVYVVTLGGFDTHSAQVQSENDTKQGAHANLLSNLSTAIEAFQDDLSLHGLEEKVAGMTFSEFGRRIISNFSLGTDHGAAAPLFVFGAKVNPMIHGSNPFIPNDADAKDNINMEHDFRDVYYSVLKDWFGVSDGVMQSIGLDKFNYIPLFKSIVSADNNSFDNPNVRIISANPNPIINNTTLTYQALQGKVSIDLYDIRGIKVMELFNGFVNSGKNQLYVSLNGTSSGNYYISLKQQNYSSVFTINKVN